MGVKFCLESSLGFLTNLAGNELKYSLTRSFKENGYDVPADQFGVLASLWRNDAQTQTELATHLVKDKTNMTRILDGLVKRNLVVRMFNESDRRSYRIHLTDEGRELEEKLVPIANAVNERALEGLDPEEVKKLKSLLKFVFSKLR